MACILLVGFFLLSRQAAFLTIETAGVEEKKNVIVIDPGHGGIDPGVVGVNEIEEKQINLEISLKLKEILMQKGFDVVMIREEDKGLYEESSFSKKEQDMKARVNLIEGADPILTISIHQNSFQDCSVSGPQVFYYSNSSNSKYLAEFLQERLNQNSKAEKARAAKENDSYYLLKNTSGTIVIVECGFLTNPKEAGFLKSESYQMQLAENIASGVLDYLEYIQKK